MDNISYEPSLSFMSDLLTIASKCNDHGADTASFNLGPFDDYVLKVSINFSYEKVQENEKRM